MKYTIQHGVERQFSERVNSNLHFILPLLVILAGVTFFLMNAQNSDRKPTKPLTLGIYTINSPDENKKDNPGGNDTNSDGDNGTTNPPAPITVSELDTLAAAGNPNSASSALPVGGRGGGDIQGETVTTPAVAPVVSTTVSCVEQLTQTTLVCVFPYQYCTIPLAPTLGVKTIDGTCVIIN